MSTTQGNRILAWVLLAIAVVANIAGYVLNLYQQIAWFDKALHGYTIFAITLLLGLLVYGLALTGARDHTLLLILMVAAIGVAIGGLWEVAEWAYDQMAASNVIQGKFDTITDMIVDTVGAVAAGIGVAAMVDKQGARRT